MDLPAAQMRLLDTLNAHATVLDPLGERFSAAGFELALVGGSVRDALLGRDIPDLDFTTDARPAEILQLIADWADTHWDIGKEFGTIGLRKSGLTIEITTYRDEAYDPTSRKPAVAFGTTLDADLVRRDFTLGAMAVRLPAKVFVDPFGGMSDLVAGVLRTPGKATDSFNDDPLRMMRAARFVAQLGVTPDAELRTAMTQMADRIAIVSAERVRDELIKLVCGKHARAGIELLVDTGLADEMLPEVANLRLERDEHHRHKDVYQHSLTVLDQAIDLEARYAAAEANAREAAPAGEDTAEGAAPAGEDTAEGAAPATGSGAGSGAAGLAPRVEVPDFVVRFAALMHDVGKPATRKFADNGAVTFYHHDVVGAKLTAKRMKALRFDKDTCKAVARLVELHLRFYGYGDAGWSDSAVRRYVTDAGPLLTRLHILTRADVTTRNRRKADRLAFAYDDLEQRIGQLAEQERLDAIRPDLDGRQIMDLLGIAPGPVVGRAYNYLLEARMEHGPLAPEQAEELLQRWWAKQPEADS